MNTIFKNLLKAIGIMAYFIVLNFAYTRMNIDRLMNDIEVFSGIFLVLGLVMLERAYKKDSGKIALSGIELLCLSMHSLSINHVITFYQYDFRFYLLTSSYAFAIYYVLKSIILYTKEKRQYLRNLSDISEIIKEEPIKKEAKKREKTVNDETKVEETKKDTSKKGNPVKEKDKGKVGKESKIKKEGKIENKKQVTKKQSKKAEKKEETKKKKGKDDKLKKENKDANEKKEKTELKEEKKKKSNRKKKEVVDND